MAEIWDLLDKDGRKIGVKWTRGSGEKIPDGCYHPCAEVWFKVGDKILLTQRHPDKHEGLKFDVPGGAVVSGEEILEGAVRELHEEVGIRIDADRLSLLGVCTIESVYVASYLLRLDTPPSITLQPSEVIGYRLVTREELLEMLDELTKYTRRRFLSYSDKIFK